MELGWRETSTNERPNHLIVRHGSRFSVYQVLTTVLLATSQRDNTGQAYPTNRLESLQLKKERTFLRTAIGKASNSSSVVPNPIISFMFLRNRPADGRLLDECGRSNVNVVLWSKDWA
jgi:hypothetical protein